MLEEVRELQEFLSACSLSQSIPLLGKRDVQKQKVRERLMKEGLALFSSSGFEKTTVAHIVEKSEIARGTFYNYFPDTQKLFDALIEELNQNIKGAIQQGTYGWDQLKKNLTHLTCILSVGGDGGIMELVLLVM